MSKRELQDFKVSDPKRSCHLFIGTGNELSNLDAPGKPFTEAAFQSLPYMRVYGCPSSRDNIVVGGIPQKEEDELPQLEDDMSPLPVKANIHVDEYGKTWYTMICGKYCSARSSSDTEGTCYGNLEPRPLTEAESQLLRKFGITDCASIIDPEEYQKWYDETKMKLDIDKITQAEFLMLEVIFDHRNL